MAGGALVNVGLPCLAVMLNGNGTAHADMTPLPTRFGVWFWGNGILPPRWVPTTTGPAWELTEQLTPLAALKSSISVITGTAVKVQGSAHGNGLCGILTGAGCKGPGQEDIVNVLPSIDQLVAPQIRGGTRLGSIQAGAVTQIADSQFGAALYHTSYPAAATYNQAEFECGALFDRLFGGVTEVGDPRAKLRSSVLDIVTEDINDLLKQVGTEDRTRLEQHLTSVRDLELQISSVASTRQCQLPQRAALKSPYNQPDDRVDDIMSDLFAYALGDGSDFGRSGSFGTYLGRVRSAFPANFERFVRTVRSRGLPLRPTMAPNIAAPAFGVDDNGC